VAESDKPAGGTEQAVGPEPSISEGRDAEKRHRKEAKRREDAKRPLDAWERYRALVDALDEGHQLLEIADRKARFALVIMGALNVLAFLFVTRTELIELVPAGWRTWLGVYFLIYGFAAVYFFLQAIEALRPRRFNPHLQYPGEAGPEHFPMGLRYYEDVVMRDLEAHRRAWRDVGFGQLNAELSVQTHIMARTNQDKYRALRRLYAGLRVMTLLAAGLITALAFVALAGGHELTVPVKEGKQKHPRAVAVLGTPEPISEAGAREPSGVACDARSRHLFLVGDEGRLVELDGDGRVLARHKVKGDIEDVAVHSPTGLLVMLSERKSALVVYDPVRGEERREVRFDRRALLGEEPADKNHGFEGLAFRADEDRPGGGSFYLVHQAAPAMVVEIDFDPAGPADLLGADRVVRRFKLEKLGDLTAATWVASLERLLVIADARDRLLVLRDDGTLEAEVRLPGLQQEGLCVDGQGTLWIADDRAGLVRYRDALSVLRGLVGNGDKA
jgi:uncharacterized protein YjiK/uncharacterized membrane protein YuzA (DUF378 family)